MLASNQGYNDNVQYTSKLKGLKEKFKRPFISRGVLTRLVETYTTKPTVRALKIKAAFEKDIIIIEAGTSGRTRMQ